MASVGAFLANMGGGGGPFEVTSILIGFGCVLQFLVSVFHHGTCCFCMCVVVVVDVTKELFRDG